MKKLLMVLVSLLMVVSLVACSKKDDGPDTPDNDPVDVPTSDVMSHADYVEAELETEVVVEVYVQATQDWWDNTITVYAADEDGAYFIYNMACSQEDAAKLVAGQKIKVTGVKSAWAGEVEIIDATFELVDGSYVASAIDLTDLVGDEDALLAHQNELFTITGATVVERDGGAFTYSYDGSGSHDSNSDLYFDVEVNGTIVALTVESYLCGNTTEVYSIVENLQVGDVIDVTGFMYWYEGPNPHITTVVVK